MMPFLSPARWVERVRQCGAMGLARRGEKHDGCIPRPSQPRLAGCDGCISVGDPSSAPIEEKVSSSVLFRKVRVSGGWTILVVCSLRIGSPEPPERHGPIVLRCPGNGPETPSPKDPQGSKKGDSDSETLNRCTRGLRYFFCHVFVFLERSPNCPSALKFQLVHAGIEGFRDVEPLRAW